MAFTARDYSTGKILNDPSIVEWKVNILEGDTTGDKIVQTIGTHLCTDEDYSKFWPSSKAT
jgi:hypothetical protein